MHLACLLILGAYICNFLKLSYCGTGYLLDIPTRNLVRFITARNKWINSLVFLIDWENWTAALVSDSSVRDMLVSAVRNYAADGLSSAPLGDWYETTNGGPEGFRARPVVGGHLALVSQAFLDVIIPQNSHNSYSSSCKC